MTNTLTAYIFEDTDKNDWVIFGSSPPDPVYIADEYPEEAAIVAAMTDEDKKKWRELQQLKGNAFGFTITDRVRTFNKDIDKWRTDREVPKPEELITLIDILTGNDILRAMKL